MKPSEVLLTRFARLLEISSGTAMRLMFRHHFVIALLLASFSVPSFSKTIEKSATKTNGISTSIQKTAALSPPLPPKPDVRSNAALVIDETTSSVILLVKQMPQSRLHPLVS